MSLPVLVIGTFAGWVFTFALWLIYPFSFVHSLIVGTAAGTALALAVLLLFQFYKAMGSGGGHSGAHPLSHDKADTYRSNASGAE
ncbi:hypothetical protein [Poseidonocella sp. HB161398]|uniref:hypothetical protein n=1 Tax=Poseidonocella sp. HB161398 TaxID=2320855 RepID=UPI00110945D8|nr:hypothetical protein [Poseidonocella sp. HB161398]